jgi:hypothetical protein
LDQSLVALVALILWVVPVAVVLAVSLATRPLQILAVEVVEQDVEPLVTLERVAELVDMQGA